MPEGPGKYDPECLDVMTKTGAHTVIVIVIGGDRGTGFSVNSMMPDANQKLPPLLRNMADQIEGVS